MLRTAVLSLLLAAAAVRADTPANCSYSDIQGEWLFYSSEPTGDSSIQCDDATPMDTVIALSLQAPNTVVDTYGNVGTWTLIYNQGFEATVNGRTYFAFSYYTQDGEEVTSLCDRTFPGWSHDITVRNWACIRGQKQGPSMPKTHRVRLADAAKAAKKYVNNHALIAAINARKESKFTAKAYPQHEKYTVAEMYRRSGGARSHLPQRPKAAPMTAEHQEIIKSLPASFDWGDVNGVSFVPPVRDQANCGSCYAFASMAALESQVRILTNNTQQPVFSPQDIVSCSEYSQGCDGGFPYLIAGKYAKDFGVVAESCNEYQAVDTATCGTDSSCGRTYTATYQYVGGYYGACNEAVMMESLVNNGPLVIGFEVYDDLRPYQDGVYHHDFSLDHLTSSEFDPFELTNHAVLITGYGVEDGVKYWNVKNSWGTDWGNGGYFKIQRGTDECAIESLAVEVKVVL
ncbi:dipeptidyl peptidase 1-like isoform X2 [Amphibalanus amphitrite]|uniref:dipeptidyl peptidase 1-like isoform X2 n=1 Tax=Amphibalanus amphitrite TaxID=1232801 RepID=UPI001C905623|nr:dipeptidyl peptidase 1-like isoform X2 [Amphibalanus amphitrite]